MKPKDEYPERKAVPDDYREAVQRIATVCGEFSLGGCGITQYRATFPAWVDEDGAELKPQEIVQVQPEKVEGIFTAIYLRLKQTPEYQPLESAIRERNHAWWQASKQGAHARAADALILAIEEDVAAKESGDQWRMNQAAFKLGLARAKHESAKKAAEFKCMEG